MLLYCMIHLLQTYSHLNNKKEFVAPRSKVVILKQKIASLHKEAGEIRMQGGPHGMFT